jgi:hypothetical protein
VMVTMTPRSISATLAISGAIAQPLTRMSQNSWRKSLRTATARWACDAQVHLNDAIPARAPKAEPAAVDAPHLDPAIAALFGIDGDNATLVDAA